jgi:phosphatidylglycerophosphate synthase
MSPPDTDPATRSSAASSTRDWKIRFEDPVSRFFRYPLAKLIVRGLVRTPITPNQVTLAQPLLAAAAAVLITSETWWKLALAAAVFEVRSILDCVDGTLARAKKLTNPWGHAIDGVADWLSVLFLYAGILRHFQLHPPRGPWGASGMIYGILGLALFQGALRSFASDYYKLKYASIFERGRDATVDALREKMQTLSPESGLFAHLEVFIGRAGYLAFEHAWFDPRSAAPALTGEQVRALRRQERSPTTRLLVHLWSLSNGDAFITLVCLSAALGKLWEGQVFFASFGVLWIAAVILLNGWFLRSTHRRGSFAAAPAE